MKKLTWKQKLLALVLFCCLGIVPNDEAPAPQSHIDESVNIRDTLVKHAADQEAANQEYIMSMIKQSRGSK